MDKINPEIEAKADELSEMVGKAEGYSVIILITDKSDDTARVCNYSRGIPQDLAEGVAHVISKDMKTGMIIKAGVQLANLKRLFESKSNSNE